MRQSLGSRRIIRSADGAAVASWQAERNGAAIAGLGSAQLLQGPLTAFFASRQCPGTAIRAATDWALQQARDSGTVIGGFHSPLERSVLRLLIEARSPVVVVLGRPVAAAALGPSWRSALQAGSLAVVSNTARAQRLTEQMAAQRNELVARLADRIVFAYASPGGGLRQQCARWIAAGREVKRIGDPPGSAD